MSYPFVISATERIGCSYNVMPICVSDLRVGWQSRSSSELIMIKGVRSYSWLYWSDGTRQIMAYTMKYYIDQLPTTDFIRVHQNCLINRAFVQKAQLAHRGPIVHLSTGIDMAISRRRWSLVKKELQDIARQVNQDN